MLVELDRAGDLIATLREACGEAWSDAAEAAWQQAYASLVTAIHG